MAAAPSPLWFHLLAGPNGAGKSTLYRALVREGILGPPLEFVNADLHERDHLQHMADPQQRSEAARAWADARRAALLAARTPLASETVFSHPSKLELIGDAQRQGYTVALHVVALDDPQRLLVRVAQRVREGGHPVPPERILSRYPRTMALLEQAVQSRTSPISTMRTTRKWAAPASWPCTPRAAPSSPRANCQPGRAACSVWPAPPASENPDATTRPRPAGERRQPAKNGRHLPHHSRREPPCRYR